MGLIVNSANGTEIGSFREKKESGSAPSRQERLVDHALGAGAAIDAGSGT